MVSKFTSSVPILVNGSMSGNLVSDVVNIQAWDNVGIQLIYSGSPVGSFQVQCSQDYAISGLPSSGGVVTNAGSWITVPAIDLNGRSPVTSLGTVVPDGYADEINLNNLPFDYLRVTYTWTSGTGTLNINCTLKCV